jgi:hypothetical protein
MKPPHACHTRLNDADAQRERRSAPPAITTPRPSQPRASVHCVGSVRCGPMHAPVGQPAAAVPCFRAARRCARRRAVTPACSQGSQAAPAALASVAARRGGRSSGSPPTHFLHIDDLTQAQLDAVLARAVELKARYRAGDVSYQPLRGMSMAMIFAKPSLRTRVSFETVREAPLTRSGRHPLRAAIGLGLPFASAPLPRGRTAPLTRRDPHAGLCVAGRPRHIPRA